MGVLRRLVLANPLAPYDADARDFIQRVERADGQALETGVRQAIDVFIRGCKADGIWNAIKASCILAGARTLTGALVPLKGAAPTSFNFVSGDYNRKTGLAGNGSTKYLNSNRANNADPQNNQHLSAYATTAALGGWLGAGGASSGASALMPNATVMRSRSRSGTLDTSAVSLVAGFSAISRSGGSSYTLRAAGANSIVTRASDTPTSDNMLIFERAASDYTTARLAFYSIGESLDLALLDTRVITLINTLSSVIP